MKSVCRRRSEFSTASTMCWRESPVSFGAGAHWPHHLGRDDDRAAVAARLHPRSEDDSPLGSPDRDDVRRGSEYSGRARSRRTRDTIRLMTTADDVCEFLELMSSHGIRVWLDGGWAADALVRFH